MQDFLVTNNPGSGITGDFPIKNVRSRHSPSLANLKNSPDFCPTTLSDVRLALQRMDEPEQVAVAMIAVDPDRDLPILDQYVTGFFPDNGHALGTDDPSLLASVAAPFGAQYDITTNDDGEIEVAHTTQLYAVNDAGEIALTWQFGVPIDDLAGDFDQLLEATA